MDFDDVCTVEDTNGKMNQTLRDGTIALRFLGRIRFVVYVLV
jgi:hypothetical protein